MGWRLDLTGETPETMDAIRPPEGWYKAILDDTQELNESGGQEFTFKITGPVMVGAFHKETLYNPENGKDEKAQAFMMKKATSWGARLGLAKKDDAGKEIEIEWTEALNKEFVLHLKNQPWQEPLSKAWKDSIKLDWAPYPLDHEGIPPEVRQRLGLPLLPGQVLPQAVGNPGDNKTPAKKRGRPANAEPRPAPIGAIDVSDL